jgi:hypothetical protein
LESGQKVPDNLAYRHSKFAKRFCPIAITGSVRRNGQAQAPGTEAVTVDGHGELFFRRQNFLHAYLIDKMLALQFDQMRSLLVVCQMRADPIDHHRYQSAITHVQPKPSSNELVGSVSRERTIGVGANVWFIKARHKPVVSGHLVAKKKAYALWLQKPLRRYTAHTCRHVVACERCITGRADSNKGIPSSAHHCFCS